MIEFPSRQSKHGFNQVDTYIILLSDQKKIGLKSPFIQFTTY